MGRIINAGELKEDGSWWRRDVGEQETADGQAATGVSSASPPFQVGKPRLLE